MKRKKSFAEAGGSASRPPGFIAFGPEWLPGCGAAQHRPGHSGAWVDARVASQQSSIPRPGDCSVAAEGNRTISLANKTGQLDKLTTGTALRCQPKVRNSGFVQSEQVTSSMTPN